MALKSLGLIETAGLTAAIEAADAAVKSANVQLVGYELAKGGGMTAVKVFGDVGAVQAAVSAGAAAAARVGTVVSTRVIPRPAQGIEMMVLNKDTVGLKTGGDKPKPPTDPTPGKPTGGGPAPKAPAAPAKKPAGPAQSKKAAPKKPVPKPEVKKPLAEAAPKAEAKPEAKPPAKPEPKQEAKPPAKPEPKQEAKTPAKPEPKAQSPEAKPAPGAPKGPEQDKK